MHLLNDILAVKQARQQQLEEEQQEWMRHQMELAKEGNFEEEFPQQSESSEQGKT